MEPQQPPESEPAVHWTVPTPPPMPRAGETTGELFANRPASTLTLGDALSTGFRLIGKPTFIVPVLIIGVIVNTIVSIVLGPMIATSLPSSGTIGAADMQAMIGSVVGTFVIAIIGSILISLYGQIWVVEASAGPLPTFNAVIGKAGQRWLGVIGTGIAVVLIVFGTMFGITLVTSLAIAALGSPAILVALVLLVGVVWVSMRLSMAVWLAAEGKSISMSIRGSWLMTKGNLLRILGWGFGYGIVFVIVSAILGAVLGLVPVIGGGIAQTISLALGYGAGVTLFRRTQAAAMPPALPEVSPSLA